MKRLLYAILAVMLMAGQAGAFMLIASGGVVEGGPTVTMGETADYTAIAGGVGIVAGVATGETNWSNGDLVYNETSTGSNDHYVEAIVEADNYGAGLVVRCNGTTGYYGVLNATNSRLAVYSFNGGMLGTLEVNMDAPTTTISAGTTYGLKMQISGSTLSAWLDPGKDGTHEEELGTFNISTGTNNYTTGVYVGMTFWRGNGQDPTVDSLEGDAL
jgi:hypothetical protein